jgi:hypothetical protein
MGTPNNHNASKYYSVVDRVIVAPDMTSHFSEKLLYMPHSYQVSCVAPTAWWSRPAGAGHDGTCTHDRYLSPKRRRALLLLLARGLCRRAGHVWDSERRVRAAVAAGEQPADGRGARAGGASHTCVRAAARGVFCVRSLQYAAEGARAPGPINVGKRF